MLSCADIVLISVRCEQFLRCFYCYLCPDGVVVANETHLKRCFAMCDNVKQYFSPNFATVNMDANNLPSLFLSGVKLFILSLCSHIDAETYTCEKKRKMINKSLCKQFLDRQPRNWNLLQCAGLFDFHSYYAATEHEVN